MTDASAPRAPVSSEAFEAGLAALAELPGDPAAGFFGPSSMMWRVGRESLAFLGAGAAILLQTAHPWVAQAIADHSTALSDPLARFHRTFRPVFAMVYGTRAQALAQARAVRGVHERITGTLPQTLGRYPAGSAYAANDAEALYWVQATLWHLAIAVTERMKGPLSVAEKNQYNEEIKRFAALFGVPNALMPKDWDAFEARFAKIVSSDALAVGEAGRMIGGYFLHGGKGSLGRVVPGWYRDITGSLLPPHLAEAFGLPAGQNAAQSWRWLAACHRALPRAVRYIGPYQEALHRLEGREPGLWTQTVNRIWLGRPRLEPAP